MSAAEPEPRRVQTYADACALAEEIVRDDSGRMRTVEQAAEQLDCHPDDIRMAYIALAVAHAFHRRTTELYWL